MFPFWKRDPKSAIAPPIPSTLRFIGGVAALALSMSAGWQFAARRPPNPIVITLPTPEPKTLPRSGDGFPQAAAAEASTCRGASSDLVARDRTAIKRRVRCSARCCTAAPNDGTLP